MKSDNANEGKLNCKRYESKRFQKNALFVVGKFYAMVFCVPNAGNFVAFD